MTRSFSNTNRIKDLLPHTVRYNVDTDPLEKVFRENPQIRAVIHTATNYGKGLDTSEIYYSNVHFPLELFFLAAKYKTVFINTDSFFNKESFRSYNYLQAYTLSKKHFLEWGTLHSQQNDLPFINMRLEHLYGPDDHHDKFVMFVLHSLIQNRDKLELSTGEQKRDFIFIDDAVQAYLIVIEQLDQLNRGGLHQFEVGTGNSKSIKEFVTWAHEITASNTELLFGALPNREGEIKSSSANNNDLIDLGWNWSFDLMEGIKQTTEYIKASR